MYALIFPKDGDGFFADILRVEKDTIVVYTTDFRYIAKKDIGKITLRNDFRNSRGFLSGMIFGNYLVNIIAASAGSQTGPFLPSDIYGGGYTTSPSSSNVGSAVALNVLGAIGGGIFGWLVDHSSPEHETFLFTGSQEDQDDIWAAIQKACVGRSERNAYRLSVSGGATFSRISKPYRAQLVNDGFSVNTSPSDIFFPSGNPLLFLPATFQDVTDVNAMRTISLSHTIGHHLEVGICIASISEPEVIGTKVQLGVNDQSGNTFLSRVDERYSGNGYYATISYVQPIGENAEALVTGGIGLARVDFDLEGKYGLDLANNFDTLVGTGSQGYGVHSFTFSGMLGGELNYYFNDGLSLGLSAHTFLVARSATAPTLINLFINEQKLGFGNSDVGVTIGLHF